MKYKVKNKPPGSPTRFKFLNAAEDVPWNS
jgi:hypothetical protein